MSKRMQSEPRSAVTGQALAQLLHVARSREARVRDEYLKLEPRERKEIVEDAFAWAKEGRELPPALSFLNACVSIHLAQEDPPEQPVSLDPKPAEATREGTQHTRAHPHYPGFSPAPKPPSPPPLPPQRRQDQGRYRLLLDHWLRPVIPAHLPTSKMLSALNRDDRRLAEAWVGGDCGEAYYERTLAQMLTARLAEKATAEFYRRLGRDVADISILQLKGGEGWKTHDLLLDGKIPVDVKNSRRAKNNESSYTEHIIPRLKQTRDCDKGARSPVNVRITGVLSPYLPLKKFEELSPFEDSQVVVLGETSWSEINELSKAFGEQFFKVQVAPETYSAPRSSTHDYLFPAWLFNYPTHLYAESRASLDKLAQLSPSEWPSLQELDAIGKPPPFHLSLAAGLPVPSEWAERIQPAQLDLYRFLLRHHERHSLPFVFLAVLGQFVRQLRNPTPDYHPNSIKTILFATPLSPERALKPDYPIGIYDPLATVHTLIDNLADVWRVKDRYSLDKFRHFQYRGAGILRAKKSAADAWTTIMAYCGGSLPESNHAKCGYPGLVLGAKGIRVCSYCHRLICPKCGFCSAGCDRVAHT